MISGNKLRGRTLIIILLALATSRGVSQKQSQQPWNGALRIQKEVRHELLLLPYLNVFNNLSFSVDGDEVTLTGQVTRPAMKADAEKAVSHIEGVDRVRNQIEVLPVSALDDEIRLHVFNAIYGFAPLQKYALAVTKPIRIIVKRGHVTLEGLVDSEADKNNAGIRAHEVADVFSVTNRLRVAK